MRQNHREVFFEAAHHCICWIGLREPNPLADRWIGKAGHIPKGENCKTWTGGVGARELEWAVLRRPARAANRHRGGVSG